MASWRTSHSTKQAACVTMTANTVRAPCNLRSNHRLTRAPGYANAVTNTTSQGADAYPYYLPLGVNIPGGARPTCSSCLQNEMAIFSSFAANSTQPISKTYAGAANTITIYCGSTFVNVTAAPLKGAASAPTASFTPTISLLLILFFYFFQ